MLGVLFTQAFQPFNASAQAVPDPAVTAKAAGIETDGDLAHLYVTDGPTKTTILTAPATTLDARSSGSVSVTPDGQAVVYLTTGQDGTAGTAIWMVNYDGTNPHMLAAFPDQHLWTAPFTWSADSKQLAYVTILDDGSLELWRMNADGTNKERVLGQSASFRQEIFFGNNHNVLSWTPDGKFLQYIDRTGEPYHKYSVDLATNKVASAEVPAAQSQASHKLNVPLFSQMDPRWKGYSLGVCGTTIGAQGCALTSTAMVFKYYGVDIDPLRLRNCLGVGACPLRFGAAGSNCSGGKVQGGEIQSFNFDTMRANLEKGYPVIIGFAVNSWASHFVVVNGGSGADPNNYTVNDPWDATNYKTIGEFIGRLGYPQQMNIYTGPVPNPVTPGEGTSRLTQFVEAYNRGGGLAKMGSPTNAAHWWYGTVIQDFPGDPVAIMQDEDGENRQSLPAGSCKAFTIRRGIFDWYAANGNPARFGPATSEEYAWNGKSTQSFREGYIAFDSPESSSFTAWPTSGDGWRREFYNNKSWGCGPAWVDYLGSEGELTSPWDANGSLPALLKEGWSARFSRTVTLPAGNYTLSAGATEGIKVWIDNTLVVNQGITPADRLESAPGNQWQGQLDGGAHQLKIEFTGSADQTGLKFNLTPDNPFR